MDLQNLWPLVIWSGCIQLLRPDAVLLCLLGYYGNIHFDGYSLLLHLLWRNTGSLLWRLQRGITQEFFLPQERFRIYSIDNSLNLCLLSKLKICISTLIWGFMLQVTCGSTEPMVIGLLIPLRPTTATRRCTTLPSGLLWQHTFWWVQCAVAFALEEYWQLSV